MGEEDDFMDFAAYWEFFNPLGDEKECPNCGRMIKPDEKVQVNKEKGVFKCPDCGEEIDIE